MKKRILVYGCFNIMHPGHLRILSFAKECGDWLIVGVLSDRLSGVNAQLNELDRLRGVQSNINVDEAFVCDKPILKLIEEIKPDVVVKGKEHEFTSEEERQAIMRYGGELIFSSGDMLLSHYDELYSRIRRKKFDLPHDYITRHSIDLNKIKSAVNNFSNLRICVIGDLIVDEYINCNAIGMSHEDPTIVVTPLTSNIYVGGAGIVALHAHGLGAGIDFISMSGSDKEGDFVLDSFNQVKANVKIHKDKNRTTTKKTRYRVGNKTLFRVSRIQHSSIDIDKQSMIFENFLEISDSVDALILSDFNYGCLPQSLVKKLIGICNDKGIFIAADSQSSSQIGDITRFQGANLITPTEREARLALKNKEDGLVVLSNLLLENTRADYVFLKMGEEGLLVNLSQQELTNEKILTDKLIALNDEPVDVAGAGDSMIVTATMALAANLTVWEAALLGSIAAGIQVGRVGNIPIEKKEIMEHLS